MMGDTARNVPMNTGHHRTIPAVGYEHAIQDHAHRLVTVLG
jgi:hypothetical protein